MSEKKNEALLKSKLEEKANEIKEEALGFMRHAMSYICENHEFGRELTADELFEIASEAWDINCWEPGFEGTEAIDEAVEDFKKQMEQETQDYDVD